MWDSQNLNSLKMTRMSGFYSRPVAAVHGIFAIPRLLEIEPELLPFRGENGAFLYNQSGRLIPAIIQNSNRGLY